MSKYVYVSIPDMEVQEVGLSSCCDAYVLLFLFLLSRWTCFLCGDTYHLLHFYPHCVASSAFLLRAADMLGQRQSFPSIKVQVRVCVGLGWDI